MELRDITILGIDDNPDNLIILTALIREVLPGARITTALDGDHGFEVAVREDPDVILLDIVMPGMDGFQVCRRLKETAVTASIPVVFLTALRTDRNSRIKALEVGAEAFLLKPLDELELITLVRSMAKIKAANRRQRREKPLGWLEGAGAVGNGRLHEARYGPEAAVAHAHQV